MVNSKHLKSISVQGLEQLIEIMAGKIPRTCDKVSSEDIATYLKAGNMHPAQEKPDLFSDEDPETALTYQWCRGKDQPVPLLEVVSKLKHRFGATTRIWIDVLFINQNSLNIGLDLGNVQAIYAKCQNHVAIESGTLLERAWCLYELLIRLKAKKQTLYIADGDVPYKVICVGRYSSFTRVTGSLMQAGFDFYSNMKATNSSDLQAIKDQIFYFFPGDEEQEMNEAIPVQVGLTMQASDEASPMQVGSTTNRCCLIT